MTGRTTGSKKPVKSNHSSNSAPHLSFFYILETQINNLKLTLANSSLFSEFFFINRIDDALFPSIRPAGCEKVAGAI